MEISLVPRERLNETWGEITPILERATKISGGRFSNISVLDELLNDRISLWVVLHEKKILAVFTVRIVNYVERRSLYVELLAGSRFKEWMEEMFIKMRGWGQVHKCTHIECGGRRGWVKLGQKYGFKVAYTVIEREI